MGDMFDLATWRDLIVGSVRTFLERIAAFLPNLAGALIVFLVGWVVSLLAERFFRHLFHRLGVDRACERLRFSEMLRQAGVSTRPSAIFARILFWLILLVFVLSGVETLGLRAVISPIDRLIAFLPNLLAAIVILALGFVFGRIARNVVRSGAAAANVAQAERLGNAAHSLVVLVVSILALEQLGIETVLLITVITAFAVTLGLTMGLAFALGAREIIRHILAGHYLRQSLPMGRKIEVGARKGVVERVGPVDTLLRDGDTSWSIPNAALLDEIVVR